MASRIITNRLFPFCIIDGSDETLPDESYPIGFTLQEMIQFYWKIKTWKIEFSGCTIDTSGFGNVSVATPFVGFHTVGGEGIIFPFNSPNRLICNKWETNELSYIKNVVDTTCIPSDPVASNWEEGELDVSFDFIPEDQSYLLEAYSKFIVIGNEKTIWVKEDLYYPYMKFEIGVFAQGTTYTPPDHSNPCLPMIVNSNLVKYESTHEVETTYIEFFEKPLYLKNVSLNNSDNITGIAISPEEDW